MNQHDAVLFEKYRPRSPKNRQKHKKNQKHTKRQ